MSTPSDAPGRAPSALDAVCDAHVEALCALEPHLATALGVAGSDDRVPDLSPDGLAERAALDAATLAAAEDVAARGGLDAVDAVTLAALRQRLGLAGQVHRAGLDLGSCNVIASPVQAVRDVFDIAPTTTAQDWAHVAARLARTPDALRGYAASLRASVAAGTAPARRQVLGVAKQAAGFAAADGPFAALVARARPDGAAPSPALAADLAAGADAARAAYAELAEVMRTEVAAGARERDAVGPQAYALLSESFVGARVDLREAYEWGLAEVARVEAEMAAVADQVLAGASAAEAIAHLEADPARRVHGTDALAAWMQELSDAVVAGTDGVHVDLPPQGRRLDCRIAPSASGGIYYTPPSEDFTRAGTMWWSVPPAVDSFGTWRERTTVFHEGVPGHHLQIATTMARPELNRWRRTLAWSSGHGEGWALYAERLMAELGWLDDPGDRMGMLDSSLFRAARVVVDIGLHCGFDAPAEVGGGTWTADALWAYLRAHTFQQEDFLRFEAERYLGWPGQAPSYKLGERLWWQVRAAAEARAADAGEAFDLRGFHRRALALGSVGLDVLRAAVLGDPLDAPSR